MSTVIITDSAIDINCGFLGKDTTWFQFKGIIQETDKKGCVIYRYVFFNWDGIERCFIPSKYGPKWLEDATLKDILEVSVR